MMTKSTIKNKIVNLHTQRQSVFLSKSSASYFSYFTMPYLKCCISSCKAKIPPGDKIKYIGQPQFWPQFQEFVEEWRSHQKTDIICGKHHAQVFILMDLYGYIMPKIILFKVKIIT